MQHEITAAQPLLDEKGNLREPGYCKKLLPIYRRKDIRAGAMRIKEWDYYLVSNGRFAVALTIDDNGYMGLDSISLLNFEEGWERTKSPMRAFPMGKTGLPESSDAGDVAISGKDYHLSFRHQGADRVLDFHMEDFLDGAAIDGRIRLTDEPEEISQEIIEQLGHSATMVPATGMYSGIATHILMCVVNRPQAAQLCAILKKYPHTFAMMNPVNEVVGNFKHVSHGREVQPILDKGDM